MQDLHDMYQAGQYEICLQQIARVLRLTGQDAKRYDKFTPQLLRGDCLLHLNDRASAIAAYQIAAKSPDPKISVPGRASELIARAADPKMTYKPTAARGGGLIDIVNDVSRRKAMIAMLDDQLADAGPQVAQAKTADNLTPIIAAVPKVLDLYALELAGTGRDEQMRPEMKAIGQRARKLIDNEVQLVEERISSVERRANTVVDVGYGHRGGQWWWNGGAVRQGLHTDDRRELRDTLDYLDRIHQSADRGLQIARQVDGDVEAWEGVIEKVIHTRAHAQNALDAE
jgi:hypothetical protein